MEFYKSEFIKTQAVNAAKSGHIFPLMAACEAALESGYGTSSLSIADRNLFGTKQHTHPIFGTANLSTKEFLDGKWVTIIAHWIVYPTYADCFTDRMNTLTRMAPNYPHYKAALAATDPITYATEVSKTWSTGPQRGTDVISIYHTFTTLFPEMK